MPALHPGPNDPAYQAPAEASRETPGTTPSELKRELQYAPPPSLEQPVAHQDQDRVAHDAPIDVTDVKSDALSPPQRDVAREIFVARAPQNTSRSSHRGLTSGLKPSTRSLPPFLVALIDVLGQERVSISGPDLRVYARDLWPLPLLRALHGQQSPQPGVVVWPETELHIQEILRIARQHKLPITPYGGGSGVLGGAMPSPGGIVMDLKRMDRIIRLDATSGTVEVEPGVLGWHLEERLRGLGFTLGHFPSSLMTASIGGYAATRSAGQFSSRYGKIEDMVERISFLSASGERFDTGTPPLGIPGPDLAQLLLGSEGTLGVITRVVLRIQRAPQTARYRGIRFHTLEDGLLAMRRIMQAGFRPSVMRLYDELDTFLVGRGDKPLSEQSAAVPEEGHAASTAKASTEKPSMANTYLNAAKHQAQGLLDRFPQVARSAVRLALGRPALLEAATERFLPHDQLLIVGCEGEPEEVEASLPAMIALCTQAGGQDLGAEPGERWLRKRYDVSFKMPTFLYNGAFVDTVEVAATWERIPALYHAVRHAVSDQVMIMAHFSHAYPDGMSIYFSLGGSAETLEAAERRHSLAWSRALEVVAQQGATVSHHHGVGLMKAAQARLEQGAFVERWRVLKQQLDPDGILNPGKLFG